MHKILERTSLKYAEHIPLKTVCLEQSSWFEKRPAPGALEFLFDTCKYLQITKIEGHTAYGNLWDSQTAHSTYILNWISLHSITMVYQFSDLYWAISNKNSILLWNLGYTHLRVKVMVSNTQEKILLLARLHLALERRAGQSLAVHSCSRPPPRPPSPFPEARGCFCHLLVATHLSWQGGPKAIFLGPHSPISTHLQELSAHSSLCFPFHSVSLVSFTLYCWI